ncbi:MAG: hypothetical protein K6F88_02900 [Ruminococcus sp.]|nr:hypothetical protein [Ruminococcus sp.]
MIDRKGKGYITIATGDIHYYEIAANLLLSYRFFCKNPLPFAIIAEEENEYTQLFDDVIITDEAMRSFNDKFLLLKLCPYQETIFFDADCLAYGDLNVYWELFADATDVSAFGINVGLEDDNGAWYNCDGIGKYADLIEYKSRVHAGVVFIRQSESLKKLYSDCMDLFLNYSSLYFLSWSGSVDECILGVAMPMNGMKTIREDPYIFTSFPGLVNLKADIYNNCLQYKALWHDYVKNGLLLHWGTIQTKKPLYKYNVECLKYMISNKKSVKGFLFYDLKLKLILLRISYLPTCLKMSFLRIIRFIKKILN